MKHIVKLVVSNPSHEFVSMRARTNEKTHLQEARSPEEAINRATRHYRTLGFMVHEATIVEQTQQAVEKKEAQPVSLSEGVADVAAAQEKQKAAKAKAQAEVDKSDVSQRAGKAQAGSALADYLKKKAEKMEESTQVDSSKYLEEKLTAADDASKWIHDFVHSDNPKFEGKSKKERIQMALGAKYAADRAVKEEVEQIDESELEEGVSRKHFQQVADLIKANPDEGKRKELAQHHAGIFAKQNPRFDRNKFYAAADVKLDEEVEQIDEISVGKIQAVRDKTLAKADELDATNPVSSKTLRNAAARLKGGIERRQAKELNKEEVEQVEEAFTYQQKLASLNVLPHHIDMGPGRHFGSGKDLSNDDHYNDALQNAKEWAEKNYPGKHKIIHTDQKGATINSKSVDNVRRGMKEEVEQIDELNKDTLTNYIRNAAPTIERKNAVAQGMDILARKTTSPRKKQMFKTSAQTWRDAAARRVAGIERAAGKLAKEEVEQIDETGVVKKTNKTLKNIMAASKGAKINAAMGDAKMDPADYGYNKAQHLNKAIGRMVSRGAQFVEEAEQVEESSAMKFKMGGRLAGDRGNSKGGDITVPQSQKDELAKIFAKDDKKQDKKLQEAEGTAPTTAKEKELAAKAGDPNKITKKDVLAARGVKLDEVKGSYKDQATEKAEDERLNSKNKAKKAVEIARKGKQSGKKTVTGDDVKHEINVEPTADVSKVAAVDKDSRKG